MSALTAEGLNTYYGKSHILHDVGLTVAEGQHHHIAWPQRCRQDHDAAQPGGADPAATGRVQMFGQDTTGLPPFRIAAAGVGYVPEGRRVFANLTVEENLQVPVERPGPWTIARMYQLFPRLGERAQQPRPADVRRRAGDAVDRAGRCC